MFVEVSSSDDGNKCNNTSRLETCMVIFEDPWCLLATSGKNIKSSNQYIEKLLSLSYASQKMKQVIFIRTNQNLSFQNYVGPCGENCTEASHFLTIQL